MKQKLTVALLVVLVLAVVGIGVYAAMLNRQINDLGSSLDSLEAEQSQRLDALESGLSGLQEEMLDELGQLEENLNQWLAVISGVQDDVNALSDELLDVNAALDELEERLEDAENELAEALIDPSAVFAQVSQSVVRISNGQATAGSGVIMDTEGRVLTARHVIESLSEIYVVMYDGRVAHATVLGSSAYADIAVLQMDTYHGITPPPLADSSLVTPGTPVVAIGSPSFSADSHAEFRDTVTAGIVSQVNRYAEIDGWSIPNLIQFDAPVNPGNSGCPLFNAAGEVVGIVIISIDPSLGEGISFAVSANKAARVAAEILEKGHYDQPRLGVIVSDLTPEQADDMGLDSIHGVRVVGLSSGGPAEAAGITAGDIILSVNGVITRNTGELISYLAEYIYPGDTVVLEVWRHGEILEISVEVGTL